MATTLDQVIAATRARVDQMLPLLEAWVRENSYSKSVDGVNRMADRLAEAFAFPALSLTRHPGDGVGDHLEWRTERAGGGAAALLVGHHDTVFPPGTFDTWDLDGDKLSGPGVLDMKGGLATVWAALGGLHDVGALEQCSIAMLSVGDEEIGSTHSRPFTEAAAKGAAAALVFEAGRKQDAIITRRKGTGALHVTARGVAAHAANHHKDGINAIWALAQFVDGAQKLTDYDHGVTVNVGLIEGGEARNTVPPLASCEVDFRFIRSDDGHALVAKIDRVARDVAERTGAKLSIEGGVRRAPLERTDASAALCQQYAECAAASGLGAIEADRISGGSDANTVSAVGVPSIDGLGPRGAGFHTRDEYIEVSSLALRAEALVRFLWAHTRPGAGPG